jgi:hypothetical protein
MIGGARKRLRVFAFDVRKLLDFGDHFDDSPVRSGHQIPTAQDLAARQHQRDFLARYELRVQAALSAAARTATGARPDLQRVACAGS